MNQRPTGYESVALPLSYTGDKENLTFRFMPTSKSQIPKPDPKINPQLREKLLKETKNPFYGPRRVLWFIFFGAASLGLLIMLTRVGFGEKVLISDLGIQGGAFLLFGGLIWFDRKKDD